MNLKYDRTITIAVGNSRISTDWRTEETSVSALYDRFVQPHRGSETIEGFFAMSKAEQDKLKDIGGFVGGRLNGSRRKAENIESRSLVSLDIDSIPAYGVDKVCQKLDSLHCGYCIYSTRKHRPEAPRLRVAIVTDRDMTPDEYDAVIRRIAQQIGMAWMDQTTFEPNRLMYWPSCCANGEYIFKYNDAPLLAVDAVLGSYTWEGKDWHDFESRPKHPEESKVAKHGAKQQKPIEKNGAIGAFCRLYRIERVMDELIPGVYTPVDTDPNRYTYVNGSTTGGAIIYDDGLFLQSFHSTDPANGMRNAFDLLRIHKFGSMDGDIVPGTPGSQLPSYKAALEYIRTLPDVQEELSREIAEEAKAAFAPFVGDGELDRNALEALSQYAGKTICCDAVRMALKAFGFTVRTNLITGQTEVGGLPSTYSFGNALNTLPILLKDALKGEPYKLKGVTDQAIIGYTGVLADEQRYNPVQDMLTGTEWDGTDRFVGVYDTLGLTDPFDMVLTRKWLIQCVALAFNDERHPIGAEGVLTLQGPQGTGKTEFFRRLAVCPEWFTEGLSLDVSNKDSVIKSVSAWIVELGELDSTTRREQSALKAHLTANVDDLRAPYARAATRRVRRTSFCATVNPENFLTDDSGNRRYWVIEVPHIDLAHLLTLDAAWFRQLWAQVYPLWLQDRNGFRLTRQEKDQLMDRNKRYETFLPGEEEIRRLLEAGMAKIPVQKWQYLRASDVLQKLVFTGLRGNLNSNQVGKALSRVIQDYPEMVKTVGPHNQATYLLPLERG